MGKKKKPNPHKPSKRWEKYTIKDSKIVEKKKTCPKCGPFSFLAQHKDRLYCGKCNYTEFIKK